MKVICNELISERHQVGPPHLYLIPRCWRQWALPNLQGHSVTPVPVWRTPRPLASHSWSSHTRQERARTQDTRALAKAQHCKHCELRTVNREPCVWSVQPGSCWCVSGVGALDNPQSLIHHHESCIKTHRERVSFIGGVFTADLANLPLGKSHPQRPFSKLWFGKGVENAQMAGKKKS